MRKMFASLFLFCMCALAFVASAEVVNDQSCQYDVAASDSLHVAPEATVESVGIGVDLLDNHDPQELTLITVESVDGNLEADAPLRYDKLTYKI